MTKLAVVTAASKGIGGTTAMVFAKSGYDVVINYRQDDAAAEALQRQIKDANGNALLVKSDIFTQKGIDKLFEEVSSKFGEIDVLVNNAGSPTEATFGEYNTGSIIESLTANFISSVLCTQSAAPLMKNRGSILFTSSIYGLPFGGNPGLALYSAGKAAIINFAQTMAEKLSPRVRCNVVAPGSTHTPLWEGVSPAYIQKSLDMTLAKEWVEAEEIAEAFLFLANTPHITGQTITVDGGWQKKIRDNSPKRQV